MRTAASLVILLMAAACGDRYRETITFSCEASGDERAASERQVRFHYDDGFLFLQNDDGRADNVCSQAGTTDCTVELTKTNLSVRQAIEEPNCALRPAVRMTLDIERSSGEFRLTQEDCNPRDDLVITGVCRSD